MTRMYEIIETSKEFTYKERNEITSGCTTWENDYKIIESFRTIEEAKEAFKKYSTDIWVGSAPHGGSLAVVTEYSIQENVYDEDGEWNNGGDIWETTELPFTPWEESDDEDDDE